MSRGRRRGWRRRLRLWLGNWLRRLIRQAEEAQTDRLALWFIERYVGPTDMVEVQALACPDVQSYWRALGFEPGGKRR